MPTDVENIHWSMTDPNVYRYPNGWQQLVEVSINPLGLTVLHDFSDICGDEKLLMEPHGRPSWDDRYWGFSCPRPADDTHLIFAYDMVDDVILWQYRTPLPTRYIEETPMPTATGEYFVVQAGNLLQVFDRAGDVVGFIGHHDVAARSMWMQKPEHSSLGLANTAGVKSDVWVTVNFGNPVPYPSTLIAYFVQMVAPYIAYRYVGEERGYPYPPSGAHHSALRENWVWTSIAGNDRNGLSLLDNEVLLTSLLDARVGRLAHHRSAVGINPQIPNDYWQEPHITASPSGTRAVFGSDWSVGLAPAEMHDTVETYVVELEP
jgi:hypothetical protein